MNKVVKHHYPVEQLPEDLRSGLASTTVTIVVTEEGPQHPTSRLTLDALKAIRDQLPVASDNPAERIRALRDEWN